MSRHARHVIQPIPRRDRDRQLDNERNEREERRRDGEQDGDDARFLERKESRVFGTELLRFEDQREDSQAAGDGGCRVAARANGWVGVDGAASARP